MKKIILATIPSTGTNFFKKVFEDHGLEVKALHLTDQGLKRVIEMGWCDGRGLYEDSVLVTTCRNWHDVKQSWDNRGRDDNINVYLKNWFALASLMPIVVSVDSESIPRLAVLSKAVGVELKADWTPVPSRWKEAVR